MKNTLSVYEGGGRPAHTFPAPADRRAARNLWCFLVGNLQPGFAVELVEGEAKISWASGDKVPVHLYERLMRGDDLSDLVGGQ